MSEYGYIPEAPEQSFGNNKGIFKPKDIYDLTRADKYTNYGQLELIETQIISSTVEYVIFNDIKENEYNVHFMTINGLRKSSNGSTLLTLSNDNATTFETSGYQYAIQRTQTNGSFAEEKSTSSSSIRLTNTVSTGTGETGNLYCYMYNLGDSTKFNHFTYHTAYSINSTTAFGFGGGVRTTAETINAFRIQTVTADIITECTISLYGIKEYS